MFVYTNQKSFSGDLSDKSQRRERNVEINLEFSLSKICINNRETFSERVVLGNINFLAVSVSEIVNLAVELK